MEGGRHGRCVERLEVENLEQGFGDLTVFRRFSLAIEPGEFVAIVGPSGCGKSTLLQTISGLLTPTVGAVRLGRDVTGEPAHMVYLFQQYNKSLLPWLTVIDNVRFSFAHADRLGRGEATERCMYHLQMVGLQDFARHYPWQLSGGMQQRVTIARALAAQPSVLLMDEPFSSVDALTRLDLQQLILELWSAHRFTVVMVTHDVDEAVYLADRVAVLSQRPATISEVIATDLPRPRDPLTTRERPEFIALRHRILQYLLSRDGDMRAGHN